MNSNRNNDDAVLHDLSPKGKRVSAARYHTSRQSRNAKSTSRSGGSNGTEHGRGIDKVVTEGQQASLHGNGNGNVNMNPLPQQQQQQQQQQKGGIISDESSHGDHCDEDTNHSTTTSSTTSTPEGVEREGQGDGNVAQGRGREGEYTTRSNSSSSRTTVRKSASSRRRMMTGRVLEPMADIVQSPYEKNCCAEVNETCFETLISLMEPPLRDDDDDEDEEEEDPSVEQHEERRRRKQQQLQVQRDRLFGDVLARILYQAYGEIQHSGLLFNNTWREGKIRQLNLGWIPKRQLLICLSPEHFADAESTVLQAVIKNLDCVALLMEALNRYHFSLDYPNLTSNKHNKDQNLVFLPEAHKPRCFKCVLFVARSYATMENLQLAQHPSASLTKKMRRCLSILNEHVRPNQAELTRLLKTLRQKKKSSPTEAARAKLTTTTTTELWRQKKKKRDNSRSASTPSSVTTHNTGHHHKRVVMLASSTTDHPSCAGQEDTSRAHKKIRRRHYDHNDHSPLPAESMLVSFQILREQMERMNHLVEHYGTQLYGHRESVREEEEEEEERAPAAGETTRVRQDHDEDEVEGEEEDNYS